MAINGADYTRKFNKVRDEFYEKSQEQKSNFDKEIDRMGELNSSRRKDIKDNYTKSLSTKENAFAEKVDSLRVNNDDIIHEKDESYQKQIRENKKKHHAESSENLKKFRKEYDEMTGSYKRASSEERGTNEQIQSDLRKNYKKMTGDIKKKAEDEISLFKENALGGSSDLKSKLAEERRAELNAHQAELSSVVKSEIGKRNALKENALDSIKLMREQQNTENRAQRTRQKDSFKKLVNDTDHRTETLSSKMSSELDRIVDKQKTETKEANLAFGKRFEAQEKEFNKDVRQLEMANKRNSVTRGSSQGEILEKQRESERDANKTRISSLNNDAILKSASFSNKMSDAVSEFQDTYRDMKIDNANNTEMLERKYGEENRNDKVKAEADKSDLNRSHEAQLKRETSEVRSQMINNDRSSKKRMNEMKHNYSENLSDINKNTEEKFSKMRADMNVERKELKETLSEQNNDQKLEMRNMFLERIDKMNEKYGRRIANLELQNETIKVGAQDSINNIMKKTQATIKDIKESSQKGIRDQVDAARKSGDDKAMNVRKQMEDLHTKSLTKMAKLRLDQQRTLKNKEFRNHEEMKVMQDKYQDIIDQNSKFSQREYERLKLSNDLEKQNLITQYESQIKTLKDVQSQKLTEIQEFNRLHNM